TTGQVSPGVTAHPLSVFEFAGARVPLALSSPSVVIPPACTKRSECALTDAGSGVSRAFAVARSAGTRSRGISLPPLQGGVLLGSSESPAPWQAPRTLRQPQSST